MEKTFQMWLATVIQVANRIQNQAKSITSADILALANVAKACVEVCGTQKNSISTHSPQPLNASPLSDTPLCATLQVSLLLLWCIISCGLLF